MSIQVDVFVDSEDGTESWTLPDAEGLPRIWESFRYKRPKESSSRWYRVSDIQHDYVIHSHRVHNHHIYIVLTNME